MPGSYTCPVGVSPALAGQMICAEAMQSVQAQDTKALLRERKLLMRAIKFVRSWAGKLTQRLLMNTRARYIISAALRVLRSLKGPG